MSLDRSESALQYWCQNLPFCSNIRLCLYLYCTMVAPHTHSSVQRTHTCTRIWDLQDQTHGWAQKVGRRVVEDTQGRNLEKGFQHLVCFILSAGSYECVVQVLGFKEEGKISKQMVKFLADTPKESWVEVLGCVAVPPNGEDGKPIPITGTSQQVPTPKDFVCSTTPPK